MSVLSHVGPTPWNEGTHRPDSRTLPSLLTEFAGLRPDAPAVSDGDESRTYGQLADAVAQAAARLQALEVQPGATVALLAPNSVTWLEAAFGALRRGAVVHAFNTWVRAYDLDHLLNASKAQVLLMSTQAGSTNLLAELQQLVPELWESRSGKWSSQRYPHLRRVVVLDTDTPRPLGAEEWSALTVPNPEDQPDHSDPATAATVLYTSGSTRYPKAVPLVHGTLIDNGFAIGERMRLTHADRVWLGSPLFWSYGIANAAMATLSHGACLVLQDRFTPQRAAQTLQEQRCTAAYLLPTMIDALHRECADQVRLLSRLRTGLTIGRPDELEMAVHQLGITGICNVYGSTETYGNCCVTFTDTPLEDRLECQGPPLPEVELRIVDPLSGEPTDRGVTGEIQVRGHLTREYLGAPDLTAQAFTADGWYRTGDTGLLRTDGQLQFVGRHSDMIKSSGINVSPLEVESFLHRHPDIDEVIVVGAPHPSKGEIAVAFVTTSNPHLSEAEVLDFCRGSVAAYKVPARVLVVHDFPRTSTGKVARRELKEPAAEAVQVTKSETRP